MTLAVFWCKKKINCRKNVYSTFNLKSSRACAGEILRPTSNIRWSLSNCANVIKSTINSDKPLWPAKLNTFFTKYILKLETISTKCYKIIQPTIKRILIYSETSQILTNGAGCRLSTITHERVYKNNLKGIIVGGAWSACFLAVGRCVLPLNIEPNTSNVNIY